MLSRSVFTYLEDGRPVHLYRITNDFGEFLEILDYGACIYSLNVLDNKGSLGDVLLGIRDAGQLTRGGYGKQLFTYIPCEDENQLCLHLTDIGAGGYDNNVDVTVSFTFGNDHCLRIHYHMVGEEDTLLCPTNHAYFNLDGTPDICSHELCIHARQYAVKGASGMPEGETTDVEGTPFDFRSLHPIADAFQEETASFFSRKPPELDDTFLLGHPAGEMALAARLQSQESGRTMDVYTDMPALIAFTMFIREPKIGKHEQVYQGYKAIALETQYVPNAVNCTGFEVHLFRAGQPLDSETVYAFGIIKE